MSKNLDAVLKAWELGKPRGKHPLDQKERQGLHGWGPPNPCWTDGRTVYSYALAIMWRDDVGNVHLHERDSTRTTNRHIDACRWHLRKNSIEGVAWDVIQDHAAE